MNGPVIVEEVVEPSVEVLEALGRLLPQLTASARIPDAQMFERLTKSHGTHLFVARDESGRIVGTLTLVVFDTPLARRARIEDVVVDTEARGLGIGEALTKRGLALAAELGSQTVDLTTRANREAANRLYSRVGFSLRETNVYRLTL